MGRSWFPGREPDLAERLEGPDTAVRGVDRGVVVAMSAAHGAVEAVANDRSAEPGRCSAGMAADRTVAVPVHDRFEEHLGKSEALVAPNSLAGEPGCRRVAEAPEREPEPGW